MMPRILQNAILPDSERWAERIVAPLVGRVISDAGMVRWLRVVHEFVAARAGDTRIEKAVRMVATMRGMGTVRI
jgi:hypothetical protein